MKHDSDVGNAHGISDTVKPRSIIQLLCAVVCVHRYVQAWGQRLRLCLLLYDPPCSSLKENVPIGSGVSTLGPQLVLLIREV